MKNFIHKNLKGYLFIAALLIAVIAFYFIAIKVVEPFELKTYDIRAKVLASEQEHDPEIVQLLLDDPSTSLAAQQEELKLGRIPWQRRVWGEVVEFLSRTQPKAIVFDINYLGPEGFAEENKASDEYFTNAVKNSTTKIFFAVLFTDSYYNLKINAGDQFEQELQRRLQRIPTSVREILESKSIQVVESLPESSNIKYFITYALYTPIMNGLLKNCFGVGTINLKTDTDGVNRKHVPLYHYNDHYYPSLSFAVAQSLLPEGTNKVEIFPDKILLGERVIPLDSEGKNITTWYGDPKTYQVIHVIDAIISERNIKAGKKPTIDPSIFKDKIVIIGQTASGSDIHSTPMANVFVGTEIVATNIDNFLNQQVFIQKLNPFIEISVVLFFCFLVWVAVTKSNSIPWTILLSTAIIASYVVMTVYALSIFKIWIDLVGPVFLLVLTLVVTYIIKFFFTHKQLESAIEQATKDGLTKLYNHRFFQEKIKKDLESATRKDDKVSLCLIDIDFFKKFNDTYGHRAGDAVLIQVAQTLKDSVRKSDLVARYGGEEMCVLLNNTGVQEALSIAQKLVDAIAARDFLINEGTKVVKVTVSIGVSTFPVHAKTVPELIEFSDKGLYRAKENGRNQVGALFDEVDLTPDTPGGPKQIKEVEIAKAKLLKGIDDFIEISQEKEYNYKDYFYYMIRDKEIISEYLKDKEEKG